MFDECQERLHPRYAGVPQGGAEGPDLRPCRVMVSGATALPPAIAMPMSGRDAWVALEPFEHRKGASMAVLDIVDWLREDHTEFRALFARRQTTPTISGAICSCSGCVATSERRSRRGVTLGR